MLLVAGKGGGIVLFRLFGVLLQSIEAFLYNKVGQVALQC